MTPWEWLFVLSNAGITLGYFFLAACVAPFLHVPSRVTRLAGVAFFVTCGFTHLDHAVGTIQTAMTPAAMAHLSHGLLPWHSVVVHVVQVVAVWVFVLGLYRHIVPTELQSVLLRRQPLDDAQLK